MYYSNNLGLKSGDRIVVPKTLFGIIQHHAIYLGKDHNGIELLIENTPGTGVHLVTAGDFFKDVTSITRIERFTGNRLARETVVKKALRQIGKPYDLIDYNCETFVSEVITGKTRSIQVESFVGILLLGLFLTWVFRNN